MIKLIVLLGFIYPNGPHPSPVWQEQKFPKKLIQATYTPGTKGGLPAGVAYNCLVSFKKEYDGNTYVLTKETCEEVNNKLLTNH